MQQAEQNQQGADYEQIAEFVDALIAKKYPGEPAENYHDIREEAIQSLRDQINAALYSGLTPEQKQELESLAETNGDSASAFIDFFTASGINFNQAIQKTLIDFGTKFLGGTNE